jgi:long-subunit fatty acid transport protein
VWNNASVGWVINDRFSWRNTLAFNILVSKEFPWNEVTITSVGAYRVTKYFETTLGIYSARTKQTLLLTSFELRPFIGLRFNTNNEKRWMLSNLTRFEMRMLIYSHKSNSESFRIKNRTFVGFSLNKKSFVLRENNFFVFGYFEAFINIGDEVKERFFNQFKYKLGFGYRINQKFGVDLGVIYQEAKDNVLLPANLPTTIITDYIFEWGFRYII